MHPAYWRLEGKVFGVPQDGVHEPPLSFVGSQRFAQVRCGVWGVGCGVWCVRCGVWGVGFEV